jgi:biopolymer transport protein ExbD
MGAQLGGSDERPIAEINVVPLVDIILVVLIIFMVTAPMVLKPSIDVNLPKAASGEDSPATPLTIAIGREGEVALNGKPASLTEIAAFATELAKDKPDSAAILEADKSVTLERLTELIDVVKAAGIKRVAFSTQKK